MKTTAIIAGAAIVTATTIGLALTASADPTSGSTQPDKQGPARHQALFAIYTHTTDAQRLCLSQQGLTAPVGKLTPEQFASVAAAGKKAAEACGVKIADRAAPPGRFAVAFAKLTPEQQACLATAKVTRPAGKLTEAQRATLRSDVQAAVLACGIK